MARDPANRVLWTGQGVDQLVAVLPDRVVARQGDGLLVATAIGTGQPLWSLPSAWIPVPGVAWGDRFAFVSALAGGGGTEVEVRGSADGRLVGRISAPPGLSDVVWVPQHDLLLVPGRGGVRLFPFASRFPAKPDEGRWVVAFTPDGSLLLRAGDGELILSSRTTRRTLATFLLGSSTCGAFDVEQAADGRLAVACADGVRMVDPSDGSVRLLPTPDRVTALALRDNRNLAVLRNGTAVTVEGVGPAAHLHEGSIWDAVLEDQWLVTSGRTLADRTVRAWRWPTLELEWQKQVSAPAYQLDVRDGRVAVGLDDGWVEVLDLATGGPLLRFPASSRAILAVAVLPGGGLATTGLDGSVSFWDAEGHLVDDWHDPRRIGLDFAADDRGLVGSFWDGGMWWLERGARDRLQEDTPAAIGRRYLAAGLPQRAAEAWREVPRAALGRVERLALVELGIDPPDGLAELVPDPATRALWAASLARAQNGVSSVREGSEASAAVVDPSTASRQAGD